MSRIPDQLVKISERLVRAEGLLARQRDHIRQRQEAGLDVEKFLALLLVWEQIVEQLHIRPVFFGRFVCALVQTRDCRAGWSARTRRLRSGRSEQYVTCSLLGSSWCC